MLASPMVFEFYQPSGHIGIVLKGERPCRIACLSGQAAKAGLQEGDAIIRIGDQNVSEWPHDRVAVLLFSQQNLIRLTVLRIEEDGQLPRPLAAFARALRITPRPQLPLEQPIQFIRSFEVPLSVLTCVNALVRLRRKLIWWAKRPVNRLAADNFIQICQDVLVVCEEADEGVKELVSVPIKNVMLFGTLQTDDEVWALLTRGTKRRLGLNLFRLVPKVLPVAPPMANSEASSSDSPTVFSCTTGVNNRLVPCNSLISLASRNEVVENELSDPNIKLWSRSLSDLLNDPFGRHAFQKFLRSEYSDENLGFWIACNEFQTLAEEHEMVKKARDIWIEYLDANAKYTINIDSDAKQKCYSELNRPHKTMFRNIQEQIYKLMKYDSYPRFLRSDIYSDCQGANRQQAGNEYDGFSEKSSDSDEQVKRNAKKFPMFHWARAVVKWKKETKLRSESSSGTMQANAASLSSCILMIPGDIFIKVNVLSRKSSEECADKTVRHVVAPLLKRRGFVWYRTYLEDITTVQIIEYSEPLSRLIGRRIFVRLYSLFGVQLPNDQIIVVRTIRTNTIRQALEPILSSYITSPIDKLHIATIDSDIQILTWDDSVVVVDNRCVAVRYVAVKFGEEPVLDKDFLSEIPDDEDAVAFDSKGLLCASQTCTSGAERPSLEVNEEQAVPQSSSSDDSPPAVFRRPNQINVEKELSDYKEYLPAQFIFSVDSISGEALQSSLSSADSLQESGPQSNCEPRPQIRIEHCTYKRFPSEKDDNPLYKPRSRLPFINDEAPNEFAAGQ